jgi:hypothetical protein
LNTYFENNDVVDNKDKVIILVFSL